MIVHPEFQELPPKPFMLQVLDVTSKIYIFLWDKKDSEGKFSISWKDLSHYYHKNTFRSNIRRLTDIGLIDFDETDDGISVDVLGWEDLEG